MKNDSLHPRFLMQRVTEALADSPVVLIHGPRQCGKTTLARLVGDAAGYAYLSFDDDVQRAAAQSDPVGFVADLPDKVVLDEIQRVPGLFTSLKAAVDSRRQAGRFILTGSANVLLVPKLADSLSGRMEILRLHPLTQCELAGADPGFLTILFGTGFKKFAHGQRQGKALADRVASGGYPAALSRTTFRRRAVWYRDYIDTLVQRDVNDLFSIRSLDALPRLLTLAAGQTARLLNVAELSGPFQLSRPTIREYITLLERVFLIEELVPWHSNRLKRLIKTPKLHLCDTGLACALLGVDGSALWNDRELYGQLLETFVFQELRRQAGWQEEPVSFYHYRDKEGMEVDVVIEFRGQRIAGVEVKASSTIVAADFKGLLRLQKSVGKRFAIGVVLYDGEAVASFGEGLFAVPLSMLWEMP
ncbi:MAG: ATP-binding protein [Desulfosudaceae bacterium]